MLTKDIQKIVEAELSERDSFEWPEVWYDRFDECIIEPFEGNFFNPISQDYEDFWVVADLEPDKTDEGYLIIYDVDTDLFGLALKGEIFAEGSGEMIGLYGTIPVCLENIPL
ncbi:MAG TPA: hypothetical protein PKJ62_05235 [Bacteroidia bacterium]|nr:hypothetical protein [Bacteroidia bacterium]HNS11119.1 hypothetical protein [Bacteroidia bacterium]